MLYCPNCGTNNTQDTKFCTNCGQKLYSITEEAVFEQETLSPIVKQKQEVEISKRFIESI